VIGRAVRPLEMVAGDTRPQLLVTCRRRDGTPINLTGYTLRFEIDRPSVGDKLTRLATISDAAAGKAVFDWEPTDWVASPIPQPANIVLIEPGGGQRTFRQLLFRVFDPAE
jgi:hypothetical protein